MSHINDRERMRDELSGFAQINSIADRINATEDSIDRRRIAMSTPLNQESTFTALSKYLQEDARARTSVDFERLYQPLYTTQDLHVGNLSQASNEARDEALRDAIAFGTSVFNNLGIDLANADRLTSVDQIAVAQIAADDIQSIADALEPQSEDNDEQIKFIVVPEDKFVKLEDYNQLAQLVVQMNSKLAELESEKFQLEARMLNMHLELTNKFIFQDNEMQTYVNSKTSDIQYLLESQMQEIRNQNLIKVEHDSTEQLTMKPVFIPEPSIKSKTKKVK